MTPGVEVAANLLRTKLESSNYNALDECVIIEHRVSPKNKWRSALLEIEMNMDHEHRYRFMIDTGISCINYAGDVEHISYYDHCGLKAACRDAYEAVRGAPQ